MSSWTPQPQQSPLLHDTPWVSSSRSSQRCLNLLGSRQDPWWSLTGLDHLDSGDDNTTAAEASCIYDSSNPNSISSDYSPPSNSPPWPLPLVEDLLVLDQLQNQLPLVPRASTATASPEELALGLSPLFLQQDEQEQLYHELLQQHCQDLLNPSSSSTTPDLPSLDCPDMTYLGLFGGTGTEHGFGQNGKSLALQVHTHPHPLTLKVDDSHHRHHSQNPNHDIFAQDNHNFLSSSLHALPHTHSTHLSMQDPSTSAVSHERTTANPVNHAFFNTSSAPSMTSTSTTTTPASSGLHLSSRPRAHGSPASSGSGSSKRKHTASPPADLDPDSEEAQVVIKRQRNTMAARKYRQKRLDRISDLEQALGEVSGERDDLKLQLARREAEVEALREMLSRK